MPNQHNQHEPVCQGKQVREEEKVVIQTAEPCKPHNGCPSPKRKVENAWLAGFSVSSFFCPFAVLPFQRARERRSALFAVGGGGGRGGWTGI